MSKNRKFRSKLSFDDDEGEAGAAAAPPPAPKEPKPRKGALLSFDDDGEGGGMAGSSKKKSSKSSFSKFHRGNLLPPPAAAAPAPARTGEYTAERLKELAAATPSLPASKKPPPGTGFPGSAAEGGLGVIKLSGSFKPAGGVAAGGAGFGHKVTATTSRPLAAGGDDGDMPLPPPPRSLKGGATGSAAAAAGGGSSRGGPPQSAGPVGRQQQQQLGEQIGEPISIVESDEEEDGFTIPGDDAIRLAKAKRERLRQAQLAPDYVPLGGASALISSSAAAAADRRRGGEAEGPASEPDSEEEPEDHLRMAFLGTGSGAAAGGSAGPGPGSRRAAAAAAGGRGLMHPADDDEEAFEEEQLRRALPARAGAAAAAAGAGAGAGKQRGAAVGWGGAGPGRPGASARRMEDITAAGENAVAALQAALQRAQLTQAQLEGNAARTADNLNDALAAIDKLQDDIKATGAKYTYVQGIRGYLADLCDCLADKGPLVEELEEALLGLREEAAAGGRAEVAEDLQVLLQQGEAAVAAAIRTLGTGGTAAAAASAASAAAAAAEEAALDTLAAAAAAAGGAANGDGEEEVDEFGRDVTKMRRREVAAGGGRRAALVERYQQQLEAVKAGAFLSDALTTTTSSSSSTSAALQRYFTKRSEVLEVVPTVFVDAAEEYSSLEAVKSRLEAWKAAYPRDYQNAYVPESAPALFAPFVRLQLLRWDPLHGQGQGQSQSQHQVARSFDQQDWYGQLFEYGMAGQDPAAAAAAADDPDANLVPQLVESLVLPQAMHLVKHCWDPFDFDQSRSVTALLTDLFVYVPADKADMGQLTSLTVNRLEEAVAAAAVPPWPAAAAAASPLAAAVQQWCFVRAVQVLRALMGLKELISQSVLVKLGVTGLLTKQLLPCLRGSTQELTLAVARAEAVVRSIPEAWYPERGGWPEVQPLLDWLASLASTLESQPASSSTGLTNKALTGRLVAVLQRAKLQDRARQLEARAAAVAAGGGGGR